MDKKPDPKLAEKLATAWFSTNVWGDNEPAIEHLRRVNATLKILTKPERLDETLCAGWFAYALWSAASPGMKQARSVLIAKRFGPQVWECAQICSRASEEPYFDWLRANISNLIVNDVLTAVTLDQLLAAAAKPWLLEKFGGQMQVVTTTGMLLERRCKI